MTLAFLLLTIVFIIVSAVMILIILVQRPQGGGMAGAFGGAGGAGTDTVFGGRVGDALTAMTVGAFALYLALAIGLNKLDISAKPAATATPVVAPTPGAPPPTPAETGGVANPPVVPLPSSARPGDDELPEDLKEQIQPPAGGSSP